MGIRRKVVRGMALCGAGTLPLALGVPAAGADTVRSAESFREYSFTRNGQPVSCNLFGSVDFAIHDEQPNDNAVITALIIASGDNACTEDQGTGLRGYVLFVDWVADGRSYHASSSGDVVPFGALSFSVEVPLSTSSVTAWGFIEYRCDGASSCLTETPLMRAK